jgi:outer membrane protein assembly factor BamB
MPRPSRLVLCLFALHAAAASAQSGRVSVLTNRNDLARSGANLHEPRLTADKVNQTNFGRLYEYRVNGQVYAQPLYVPGVALADGRVRDVLLVATMRNYVYAFDAQGTAADAGSREPLWSIGPDRIGDAVPYNFRHLIFQELGRNVHDAFGITSTPVVDGEGSFAYLVAKTLKPPQYPPAKPLTRHYLYKIRLRDGSIAGATEVTHPTMPFDPDLHLQRAALLLSKGRIYVSFGSHQDTPGFQGWIFPYAAADLAPGPPWCVTPTGKMGGIWQAGAGPAADADGNVYVMTGNGTSDARNHSMAFVRLTPDLEVTASAKPGGTFLNAFDVDLGSAGPVLVKPGVVIGGGKQGKMFLLRETPASGGAPPALTIESRLQVTRRYGPPFLFFPPLGWYHIHGSPVLWTKRTGELFFYVWPEKDYLWRYGIVSDGQRYRFDPAKRDEKRGTRSSIKSPSHHGMGMPGGILSLSGDSNSDAPAIVWASLPKHEDAFVKDVAGVLRAFEGETLKQIWTNESDRTYLFAKYCPPTVANGRVYLATFSGSVLVYGAKP